MDESLLRNEENVLRNSDDNNSKLKTCGGCISCRHTFAVLSFFGFVNVYTLRVNLSIALVAMVNTTQAAGTNGSSECIDNSSILSNSTGSHQGEFNWDSQLQGIILSAFFYGYITTQILGGWLAEHLGGKYLYGGGVLCTAALTLLTPLSARIHPYCLIAVRVLEGIGEGVTFPAMHALLSSWAPPLERSRLVGFIYAGPHFGTVIALPLSGILCNSNFLGGWPSVFYVFGIFGCIWFILWMFFVYDSPAKHPRISNSEKMYIEKSIGLKSSIELKPATPWKAIFTSVPFYAILVAHVCTNWGFYTLLTTMPMFIKHILNLDISKVVRSNFCYDKNGFYSGLSYMMCSICMMGAGLLADYLRERCLTTTVVRKLFYCLGSVLAAVFLILSGFVGCNKDAVIVLLTAAVGAIGIAMSSYIVNHLDLAAPFAGSMMGLTNTAATIPGMVSPLVVGALIQYGSTRDQWMKVFYITGGFFAFGTLFYALFGSGANQPWSTLPNKIVTKTRKENGETEEDDLLNGDS